MMAILKSWLFKFLGSGLDVKIHKMYILKDKEDRTFSRFFIKILEAILKIAAILNFENIYSCIT